VNKLSKKKEQYRMNTDNDIYTQEGYENRIDYLRGLADDYGISYNRVKTIADMLGPSEDFDGLITTLEDIA
jgi:hypothetical protein